MNLYKKIPWLIDSVGQEHRQKIRFACAGLINTGTSYIAFVALYRLLADYIIASILSYLIGMGVSYVLNRGFVFRTTAKQNSGTGQLIPFCLVNLTSLACSTTLLSLLVERLGIYVYIAQILAICVSMMMNYIGYRAIFSGGRRSYE